MIFLSGYHGSGKSFLADLLVSEFNCLHIEASAVTRSIWRDGYEHHDFAQWAPQMLKAYGRHYFDDALVEEMARRYHEKLQVGDEIQDIVVTGIRALDGIKHVTSNLPDAPLTERPNIIIGVQAEFETLYERYRNRRRKPDDIDMSEEKFRALTQTETDRGLGEILEIADYTLHNNESVENLYGRSYQLFHDTLKLKHYTEAHDFIPEYQLNDSSFELRRDYKG